MLVLKGLTAPCLFGAIEIRELISTIDLNNMKIHLKKGGSVQLQPIMKKQSMKVKLKDRLMIPAASAVVVNAIAAIISSSI